MRAIKNLLVGVCLFFAFGCDNPTEPPDTPEPANRYELLYVYQNEIHTIMSNGENHRQITQNNDYDHEPIWSPDGQKIAFVSDRTGKLEIFIMSKDGSNPLRLTHNTAPSQYPRFSPDGRKLLYRSGGSLYLMNADGANNQLLTVGDFGSSNFAVWSPDGQSIVFQDRFEIYKMNIDGAGKIRLTNNNDTERAPSYSPDGAMLLFTSDRDGDIDCYLMNADGTGLENLSDDNDDFYYLPSWSPDQTRIAYVADADQDGSNETIFMVDLATKAKVELTRGWSSPGWH